VEQRIVSAIDHTIMNRPGDCCSSWFCAFGKLRPMRSQFRPMSASQRVMSERKITRLPRAAQPVTVAGCLSSGSRALFSVQAPGDRRASGPLLSGLVGAEDGFGDGCSVGVMSGDAQAYLRSGGGGVGGAVPVGADPAAAHPGHGGGLPAGTVLNDT
jgi:hypothetical protein